MGWAVVMVVVLLSRLDRGKALAERLADVHLLDAIAPPIHYIPATMAGSTG